MKIYIRDFFYENYQPVEDALRHEDVISKKQLFQHLTFIALIASFVVFFTRDLVIFVLAMIYFMGQIKLHFLHREMQGRFDKKDRITYVVLYIITTGAYSINVVYMISYGSLEMIALCLLAGLVQAMYNFTRHRNFNIFSLWETSIVMTQAAICGVFFIGLLDSPPEKIIVIFCAIGVSGYYVVAQIRAIFFHMALNEARIEATQMQKMRAVGQLTAGVAHDFNNMLTVINGNIQLARMAPTPVEREERLTDAETASNRAAAVVAQLLTFSRKAPLKATQVPVVQFMQELERVLARVLSAGVKLEVYQEPDLAQIYCDPSLLQNTVLNLVINARDAMKGQGEITIRFETATAEHIAKAKIRLKNKGRFAHITVKDTGPGIPPQTLENVTEPFFTTKAKGKGSGLGLSTAKGFAEQSGGGMYIQSPDQAGIVVGLFIPIFSRN